MINLILKIIGIWVGVFLVLILWYALRILIVLYKASKKVQEEQPSDLPLCDTCKRLKYKDSNAIWTYNCNCRPSKFNSPPEICNDYRRK